jgi:hypothetical protein
LGPALAPLVSRLSGRDRDVTLAYADIGSARDAIYRVKIMSEHLVTKSHFKLVEAALDELLPFPFNLAAGAIPRPPGWKRWIWDIKVIRGESLWRAERLVHEEQHRGLPAAIDRAVELVDLIESDVPRSDW